jgi:predicted MFS family arabinose efflux permease
VLAATVALAFCALATFWAPAMAMLSDAAERAGLDQALAFSISNLAWAAGHVLGAGVGGAVAEATSDAVPYAALAVACAATFVGLTTVRGRTAAAAG